MKANAFRIFVVLPLLLSLIVNTYQPVQAGSPASLSPAAAPAPAGLPASAPDKAGLQTVPFAAAPVRTSAERFSGVVEASAYSELSAMPLAGSEPRPLATVPNQPQTVSPIDGATGVTTPVALTVKATDPDGGTLKVSFYGRRKTTAAAPPFTIAVIPDTQVYVTSTSGTNIYKAITQYIIDSQSARNTVFTTHVGDISDRGDSDTDKSEWINADAAMDILERTGGTNADDMPYSVMPGNHDDDPTDSTASLVNYETYFGVSRFTGKPYYGGGYNGKNYTNYSTFSTSGMRFIVINLACFSNLPTTSMLDWADSLLKDDVSRRGILVCHSMMETATSFSWIGSAVWSALKDNPNLDLIIAGHAGIGQRHDTADDGHVVYTVMSDYSGYANGGNGYYRMYEFQPGNSQIQALTYSPTLKTSLTSADHQFTIPYSDMRSPDFQLIGTVSVASGANASVTWPGLMGNTQYEWYAAARDSSSITVGPTQTFTTASNGSGPYAADDSYIMTQGQALTVPAPGVLGNDSAPDGTTLSAVKLSDPTNGAVSGFASDGSFTYTPDPAFTGTDTFTYKANDGTTDSNTATVSIIVTPPGASLVAVNDSFTTDEDQALTVSAPGVLGNDSPASGLTAIKVSDPAHGTLSSFSATGAFTYTPSKDYAGTDTFTYKANNGTADSNVATVTITMTPVNDTPVAKNDSITTLEDTPVSIPVLSNDTDVDGDVLAVSGIYSNPSHGTAVVQPNNTILYTPNTRYDGSDTFRYSITDGNGGTARAYVYVTVTHVNHAPTANDGSVTTDEDHSVAVNLVASDYDGDTLKYYIVDTPHHGSLSGTAPALTYTPDDNFNGNDSFTFYVKDNGSPVLYSSNATISITVRPVNDTPTCANLSPTTNEDSPVDINPNCSDVDGETLTIAFDQPAHGAVTLVSGKFHYAPAQDYNGSDSFTYHASDALVSSAAAVVNITVNAVNDPPVCTPLPEVVVDEHGTVTTALSCTDVDSPSLTYEINTPPQYGTASIDGATLTYQPAADYTGADSFNYAAYDGALYSTAEPVSVTVKPVVDPPALKEIAPQSVNEGSPLAFTAQVTAGDVPLASLTYELTGTIPQGAAVSSAGKLTWTPTEAQGPADYSFNLCVKDGVNAPVCQPVNITVGEINQAPALADIPAQRARREFLLTFKALASDSDLPANQLVFTLQGADVPPGANIDPITGIFTWTPAASLPAHTYAFEICVSDGAAKTCKPVSVALLESAFMTEDVFLPVVIVGGK